MRAPELTWAAWAMSLPVGLVASACGGASDPRFEVTFADELTAAPARSLDVVLSAGSCAEASSLAFDELARSAERRVRLPYPVPEDADPLAQRRPDEAVAVAVAARDADDLVMARGCAVVDGRDRDVQVDLSALPSCADAPSALDLALVVDASSVMQRANIGLEDGVRPALFAEVIDAALPVEDEIRLYVGRGDGVQRLKADLEATIEALPFEGPSHALDAADRATRELRHRARCGVEPGLLWIVAGVDAASRAQPIDVTLALLGAEADPTDDVFGFGLALEEGGARLLEASLPPSTSQWAGPLLGQASFIFQLREARRAFTARLR